MVPAPATSHQRVSRKLVFLLEDFVAKKELGEVFYAPTDVYFDDENVVQPDILFVSEERKAIITEANIQGPPDLVVEIISPGNASIDRSKKKQLYARFGVREYWLVDPAVKTIEVYSLREGKYALTQSLDGEGEATSDVLAGVKVPLAKVFVPPLP